MVTDFESDLLESNFKEDFLSDKKNQLINLPISIFALSNGKIVNFSEQQTIFLDYSLDGKIMIKIKKDLIESNLEYLNFVAVAYPFELPDYKMKSYEMILWNNLLFTQNIKINHEISLP